MVSNSLFRLSLTAVAVPLVLVAQTSATPPKPAAEAPAAKASMEAIAQKQREATLAAMQGSIDKQKAAVAASLAASIGKQGQALAPKDSFFMLAPLIPPDQNPANFTIPQGSMPDVACDPAPEDSVTPFILAASQRESLDPKLVTAVIEQESGFRPCAISDKGAQGLMQLMPETADRLSVKDPFDAKQNIDAGTKYLKELIGKYNSNLALALSAYNAGPETVDQTGGIPNIPETADYVKAILTKLGIQPPGVPAPTNPNPAPVTDAVPPAQPQQ